MDHPGLETDPDECFFLRVGISWLLHDRVVETPLCNPAGPAAPGRGDRRHRPTCLFRETPSLCYDLIEQRVRSFEGSEAKILMIKSRWPSVSERKCTANLIMVAAREIILGTVIFP